ncbi:GAF domain-containing sensor histidine kinase [Candidatus Solincola tengchongensis]|uniref:GAF domain-containing sensor histidine kinase n=1 Tax=Candidatus Solincola tengchongensis TaxID=2900693 RepID=UPI00257AB6CE|nr:GAF domain-containing sensor histidine kinase [Candidatus Solincola tengchongensis]
MSGGGYGPSGRASGGDGEEATGLVGHVSALQKALGWEREQNRALAELARVLLVSSDMEEISWKVLEYARKLTSSPFGFVGYIDIETGYLVCPTMTRDVWEQCRMPERDYVFREFRGLWGWVLRNRRPILTNSPSRDPRSTGVPEGHIPIERFLSVPALMGGVLVGQIALANSERDYVSSDLEAVSRLADLYAVAVMRMWSERELDRYRNQLEEVVRKRTRDLELAVRRLEEEVEERKRREEELRETAERLRSLSAHLQSVREEERRRIAREVHDTLGQSLTGLKIEISLLSRKLPPDAAGRLAELTEMVDDTIKAVREIATELRPSVLDDLGLPAALEWEAKRFEEMNEVECTLHVENGADVPDKDTAVALFRIAQEALTNVSRHAGARKVEVSLRRAGGELVMSIEDDGRGAEEEDLESPHALGILGMRERAYALGGVLTVRRREGGGTVVEVRVPYG